VIKLEGRSSGGATYWITCVFRCPSLCCLEEYIWWNELSTAK